MAAPNRDALVKIARWTIHHYLAIKARLPLLVAVADELYRLRPFIISNHLVLRLVRDSFDMLVIDLASLRERAVTRGLFTHLYRHLPDLRMKKAEDVPDPNILFYEGLSPREEAEITRHEQQFRADAFNKVFLRVFPKGEPVLREHVTALIGRFAQDTKPTADDRNKARAHRYEKSQKAITSYHQNLRQVQAQCEVFDRYFADLFLVIADASYSMEPPSVSNPEITALDVADLIALGSISDSTVRYGVVEEPGPVLPERWYGTMRSRYFERGGKLS
jgi:hypothetical protein